MIDADFVTDKRKVAKKICNGPLRGDIRATNLGQQYRKLLIIGIRVLIFVCVWLQFFGGNVIPTT